MKKKHIKPDLEQCKWSLDIEALWQLTLSQVEVQRLMMKNTNL